jgi:hypothetical protein
MHLRKVFTDFLKQSLTLILLAAALSGAFSVAAQTRRATRSVRKSPTAPQTAKVPVVKSDEICTGGWSGVINYEQTLDESGSKDDGGGSFRKWSHNVSYEAKMIVDGSNPKAVATTAKVEFSDVRRQQEKVVMKGQCGAWRPEHDFIVDNKLEDVETGSGAGQGRYFDLYFDQRAGTYRLSFGFESVPGRYTRESHTTRSGHCQEKNNEPINVSENKVTVIRGESGSVENQKPDPKNPDVLQGSVTIDNNDKSRPEAPKMAVTTISWKLRRCSPPLVITDVKFYHLRFPSPNTWEEIDSRNNEYTIDGNDVKIVATIVNLSGAQKSATVNFKDLTDNKDLPQAAVPASFAPHEEKQVEYIWDTSGYAWKESAPENYPVNSRKIEVRVPDDQKIEPVFVYPKPVVLIPGLWSKPEKFAQLAGYFKNQNVPWATALAPVYVNRTAASNAQIIDKTVREIQEKENAWHVDLVAHSTGGLMARAYVDSLMPTPYDSRPTALHLVMLGTPNMGTPCSSGVENVITKFFNRSAEAFGEISHRKMQAFNQAVTRSNGTKFMAVASKAIAPTCQLDEAGDGIVPAISAIYTSKTFVYVNLPQEDLGGDKSVFGQVRKWLALPPTANFAPDNTAKLEDFRDEWLRINNDQLAANRFGAVFQTVSFFQSEDDEPNFATGIKLAANASSEIEIPVTAGSRFSLVLSASPNVSATLLNEKGEVVGKSLTGTPEASAAFRTITVRNAFPNGKWKLKLESRATVETEIIVTAFIDYRSPVFTAKVKLQRCETGFYSLI